MHGCVDEHSWLTCCEFDAFLLIFVRRNGNDTQQLRIDFFTITLLEIEIEQTDESGCLKIVRPLRVCKSMNTFTRGFMSLSLLALCKSIYVYLHVHVPRRGRYI